MKSSKSIINHILKQPQNYKLLELNCFNKLKKALPKHISDSILFIYKRNRVLFFALNHPGIKMEFDYKHTLIKTLLNKIKTIDSNCQDIEIDQIRSFVSHKAKQERKENNSTIIYKERAKGDFKILCKNDQLKELFLEIKGIIKENVKS